MSQYQTPCCRYRNGSSLRVPRRRSVAFSLPMAARRLVSGSSRRSSQVATCRRARSATATRRRRVVWRVLTMLGAVLHTWASPRATLRLPLLTRVRANVESARVAHRGRPLVNDPKDNVVVARQAAPAAHRAFVTRS